MARREKKSKINLKVWVPILCILVVGITFFMLQDIQNKVEKMEVENTVKGETNSAKEDTTIDQDNNVEENRVVNETANEVENTALTNTVQNIVIHENVTPSQPAVTDKKQKAIELVKKECGNDKTVNYVFDYVNENGEYVVAVKDKTSATVKYYFRVNLETGTVELD